MKILNESNIYDISEYLLGGELQEYLYDKYTDSELNSSDTEVCQDIISICEEEFPDLVPPKIRRVNVYKVNGDQYELVDPAHDVLEYNGKYYDYTATQYNELFSIVRYKLPVIQPVLTSYNLINSTVSSVKNYVMLRSIGK